MLDTIIAQQQAASTGAAAPPDAASLLPLTGGKTRSAVVENVAVAANSSFTIMDQSPGEPGYVSDLWMTFGITGDVGVANDYRLQAFVDGETTPSIDFDLGALGGHWVYKAVSLNTRHTGVQSSSTGGRKTFKFKYPIPYKSRIKLVLVSNATAASQFFCIVNFKSGVSIPLKLFSSNMPAAVAATSGTPNNALTPAQQGNQSVNYLTRPAGSKGWVVFHSCTWGAYTNQTFLENNIVAYIDQAVPGLNAPQLNCSGTEDYFDSSYYFQVVPFNTPWAYASACATASSASPYGTHAGKDWLEASGGIRYDNGIFLTQEIGTAAAPGTSTTNVNIGFLVLYYEPSP